MENILYNISQVLGITIIHSLWQGLLIYLILRIVFACVPSLSSVKKHNLAIVAMSATVAWFGFTLYAEIQAYSWVNLGTLRAAPVMPYLNLPAGVHPQPSFYNTVATYLPFICTVYVAGLIINIAKLGWEWNKINRVKQTFIDATQMQQFINTFSKKLDLSKHIQLKFSELIDVPCVIGYLKPLIILPVSLSVHLSACEIESILLHELSHIKRNDYLVNIIQQFITIILFFNPFTLLINRIINQERENGCDDLVIEKTRRPLIYARALLKLEEARKHNLQLALAATGKNFHLLNRIERIMKTEKNIGGIRGLLVPVLLLAGGISCIAWFNPKVSIDESTAKKSTWAIVYNLPVNPMLVARQVNKPEKQQIFISVKDTANYNPFNDTTKRPHSTADKKGLDTVKETSSDDFNYDDDMPDSVKRFYANPPWKKQLELMRKQNEAVRKQFDNPAWKKQVEAMRRQGEEMSKHFNGPEWRKQAEALKKQGEAMSRQFNSAEWTKQADAMKKQGEEMSRHFKSPEWKSQVLAMQKQGEELSKQMQKQFNSPEWKKQIEDMQKQGEELGKQMQKQFDSPKWKEQMEDMQKQAEKMREQFNSPEWKKQVEELRRQGEDMQKQFNSDEWKNSIKGQQWILRDSVNGVHIYSPAKKAKKKLSNHN